MYKKNIRKVICVVVAMLIVLQVMPSTMVNAVTPAPGVYTSSASTVTLEADLSGISTNSHTRPEFVWIDGSTVFVAVRMTHNLNKMSIGTANSFDYDLYPALTTIKIDGTDYDPTLPVPLAGNVADSHWTVFRFHLADLTASGSGIYPITVTADKTGAGQGHWLTGVSMVVTVPKASATVTKTWIGGPMNPIQIQLQKQSATTPLQNHGLPVTLTASGGTATYTWNDLPYTDSLGSILTYSIIEIKTPYLIQFKVA
ncbi:MAG: Cna B-type domain-containing protein [Saccharofermentanales bacterium]